MTDLSKTTDGLFTGHHTRPQYLSRVVSVTNGYANFDDGGRSERIESIEVANEIAQHLTTKTAQTHIGVDRGPHVSPRYTVIEFPFAVGMEVSKGFNGDSYPQGKIAKISSNLRVVTLESGQKFWRRKLTESWKETGGTWSLIPGVHNDRNPSF